MLNRISIVTKLIILNGIFLVGITLLFNRSCNNNSISIPVKKYVISKNVYSNNVFFDLGANKGDSVRTFVGIDEKANGGNVFFTELINMTRDTKWIIYAFEPNRLFNDQLDDMKKVVTRLNHTVNIFKETAVFTYDGLVDFYLDTSHSNYDYIGSSINKNHKDVILSKSNKTQVNSVDIAKFIKENVAIDDLVIVKMDIEGTEYDVLIDMVKKDVFKYIDFIAIEFHAFVSPFNTTQQLVDKLITSTENLEIPKGQITNFIKSTLINEFKDPDDLFKKLVNFYGVQILSWV